jgi:NADPH:quinone reductase-like Zn-dependent oxidoreductase
VRFVSSYPEPHFVGRGAAHRRGCRINPTLDTMSAFVCRARQCTDKRDQMGMLDNKVAIVTGATSGIGMRTAELFVTEGVAVVFTGRRKVEGEAIAQRLGRCQLRGG